MFYNYILRFLLFLILLPASLCTFAQDEVADAPTSYLPGMALNKNRFFRFNNHIELSFDVSIQKGYEEYLEYLVRIVDINKQEVDVILSIPDNAPSELLIISKDKLSRRIIGITKDELQKTFIPFNFNIDLKSDQLTIGVKDTVLIENRLGLKPHTDYKITLGAFNGNRANQNISSSLKLSNVFSEPDLLERKKTEQGERSVLLWIILIVVLDIFIFAYIIVRKRKQKRLRKTQDVNGDTEVDDIVFHPETDFNGIVKTDKSAVFLFKQFEVIDKEGKDVSSRFTPLLKELFLLLLLYSQKNSKGISTGLLKDILWYDKEQQSANNNRAVNIGKLKGILDTVGGYEVISNSHNIQIKLKEDVYCDYIRVLTLLRNESLNKQQTLELVAIVRRGAFLPESNYEWLDPFKAEISDKLIDNFLNLAQLPNIADDDRLLVQIADTIFNLDSLNENALAIKCMALTRMGKRSIANATYSRFAKDYESAYGTSYPVAFSELVRTGKS